ncbi:MAG: ATP-binding cassette domain-containing protein [Candidatus Eisenbacteria bacterium]|uniref:ATP-binding cassette domain-containing protein n=1 Tax=Eiseniibacteriota bacterium TaxID=2212470 RepID=A0A948S052_UNCEI|nr:ATP-binding cassette domain-containing protein [Candidatus Eisenbacteria bacterium]MBU1947383.1 ATP-binding cassette domain-containing protein [Candidatus Eisenbacteria bacterium]MBU2693151.1 ATP-binding cassette domain-containing protein [Candidatus Eisenbacteria bacterium]
MAILECREITKRFGSYAAVDHLTFRVRPGTIFGLLGPNGSGKTTTIRMILRILLPDQGTICVFGSSLNENSKLRIGYLPEERGLYKDMKILDHLVFLARLRGLTSNEATRRSLKWLERFNIGDWSQRKVEELSKGMQQKVQFIGTLLHDPELIILDEPFSGLDPVASQLLKDIMLELQRQGRTVVFSTHQMEQVERSCDEILLIHKGKAVLYGPLNDVRARYGSPTVKVEYDGDITTILPWDGILSIDDQGRYAEIMLKENVRPGELLRRLVNHVDIRRFETSEASLDDIFIRQVKDIDAMMTKVE